MSEIQEGLMERVDQFRMLKLPGQPLSMHMGTSYLVTDLWREVLRLNDSLAVAHKREGEYAQARQDLIDFDVEDYIQSLHWTNASDYEQTLVAGNLRALYFRLTNADATMLAPPK